MKIGIIGLGLIGGSVAKAAKRQGWQVIAHDAHGATLQNAKQLGMIDEAAADCTDCARADVQITVIAVPVMAAAAVFASLAKVVSGASVITDTGSTKQQAIAAAAQYLQDNRRRFVPAHPIAGREQSGWLASSADLFDDCLTVLCPDGADADATQTVEKFWRDLGARTVFLTADKHDEVFAHISHLPHILSYALVAAIDNHPDSEELLPYAGGGFRDFVRIAGSHPQMWRDICLANRAPLIAAIRDYRQHLATLEEHIQNGDGEALFAMFDACQKLRNAHPTTKPDNGESRT